MIKKIVEENGCKITVEDMSQEEFLKLHTDAIVIETEKDIEKLLTHLNNLKPSDK